MADPKYQTNPVTVNFVDTSPTVSQSVPVTPANPLPVTPVGGASSATEAPVAPAAATATKSELIGGQYNTTLPTWADGQQGAFQISARGGLYTVISSSAGTSASVGPAADGAVLTNALVVQALAKIYNGTTEDLARSITAAANTGVGTTAIGVTPLASTLTAATVNITSGTTTAVVAGTASQKVRVYRLMLNFAATQTLNIISSGGASLNGAAMSFGANGALMLDFSGQPWFETVTAEGLSFVTTTTGVVTGVVHYIKSV